MDQYLRGGGDPWSEKSPSAKKNVDAMMEQVWPKRLRDKAFLQDSDEGKAQADAQKELVIPPAPPKADQAAWTSLVTKPPPLNSGVPMSARRLGTDRGQSCRAPDATKHRGVERFTFWQSRL